MLFVVVMYVSFVGCWLLVGVALCLDGIVVGGGVVRRLLLFVIV